MITEEIKKEIIEKLKPGYIPKYISKRLYEQSQMIISLIETCIENKEVSSCLLVGPKESGKSLTLNYSLEKVKINKMIKTIYINGKWIQNELNCLSLIKEQIIEDYDQETNLDFMKEFDFIIKSLKNREEGMIIILDEFDLFVKYSPKFIYNLLDISHFQDLTLILFFITNQYNTIHSLDRRSYSRLSVRTIHFYPIEILEYKILLKEILILKENKEWNDFINNYLLEIENDIKISYPFGMNHFKNCIKSNLIENKKFKLNLIPENYRMLIIKDLTLLEIVLLLIISKMNDISSKKSDQQWITFKLREFLTGSQNNLSKSDLLSSDLFISKNLKSDDVSIKKSLINLKSLGFIRIKNDYYILNHLSSNEIFNHFQQNLKDFPTEIKYLIV